MTYLIAFLILIPFLFWIMGGFDYLYDLYTDLYTKLKAENIFNLVKTKKIQVEVRGFTIQAVELNIRRLVNQKIIVSIPAYTFFVSHIPSVQDMVATKKKTVILINDDSVSLSIPAACANRSKDIPNSGDRFEIQFSPHQKELKKLMHILEKTNVSYEVKQAAIWIVTDDANYRDLGSLTIENIRLIREEEAAMALKICHKAGIKIEQKSIWHDRQRIIEGLQNEDLKKWLQHK